LHRPEFLQKGFFALFADAGHSLLLESAPAFERLVAFLRAR
jgi:hypothetical protein